MKKGEAGQKLERRVNREPKVWESDQTRKCSGQVASKAHLRPVVLDGQLAPLWQLWNVTLRLLMAMFLTHGGHCSAIREINQARKEAETRDEETH